MLVTPIASEDDEGCAVHLVLGRTYEVLGIEADDYRVLTDADARFNPNDPVLYSSSVFAVLDPAEPSFWISELGADGERYAYPACWAGHFFEDYHNGVQQVRERFWNDLRQLYPDTWRRARGYS